MDLILIFIPIVLIYVSQWYINSSYNRFSKDEIKSGISGAKAARMILDANNITDVKIQKVAGTLTDNFNPSTKIVSLSDDIYSGTSIASVAVAAHECGHVIQHKVKYMPIVIRSFLVPVVNLASKAGYLIMIVGVTSSLLKLYLLGLILMCASLLFQFVTLPTEFDASRRAKKELVKLDIVTKKELPSVNTMLKSAAMTYLASFFASFTQMLRLFLNINRRK